MTKFSWAIGVALLVGALVSYLLVEITNISLETQVTSAFVALVLIFLVILMLYLFGAFKEKDDNNGK